MAYTVKIWIDGLERVLTNYGGESLIHEEFSLEQQLFDREYKPVKDILRLRMVYNATLVSELLATTDHVPIQLLDGATSIFKGVLRPFQQFTVSNSLDYVDLEALDNFELLEEKLGAPISWGNYKICDSTSTSTSIVHQLALLCSSTITISSSFPDITNTIVRFKVDKEKTLSEALSQILWEYGYCPWFDGDGELQVFQWLVEDTGSPATITQTEINDGSFQFSREDIEDDSVLLKYIGDVKTKTNEVLFSLPSVGPKDGVNYTDERGNRGILNGEYWPSSDVTDNRNKFDYLDWRGYPEDSITLGVDLKKIKFGCLQNYIVGQEIAFSVTEGEFVIGVDTLPKSNDPVTPSWRAVQLEEIDKQSSYCGLVFKSIIDKFVPADFYNWAAVVNTITLIGDYIVGWEMEVTSTGTKNIEREVRADFIFDTNSAKTLADGIRKNVLGNVDNFSFDSEVEYNIGTIYNLAVPAGGLSTTIVIGRKKYDFKKLVWSYEARAITAITFTTGETTPEVTDSPSILEILDKVNRSLNEDGSLYQIIDANLMPESSAIDVTGKTGLLFTKDRLGYISEGVWTSYFSNDGTFRFHGDAQNEIEWDGATISIKGDLFLSGNSEIAGTITAGEAVVSSNYSAGVSGWQLTGDGALEVNDLTVRGSASIGGAVTIDGAVTVSAGHEIESSNYSAGVSGWQLTGDGAMEVADLTVRGDADLGGNLLMTSGYMRSSNYSMGVSGWTVDYNGYAEFTQGQIGTWQITSTLLRSAASGARVELNPTKNRVSIFDSLDTEKVAMGYLEGLTDPQTGSPFASSVYGFWAATGNSISFQADVDFYGNMVMANDQSLDLEDGSGNLLARMGTDSGLTGFHTYTGGQFGVQVLTDKLKVEGGKGSVQAELGRLVGSGGYGVFYNDDTSIGAVIRGYATSGVQAYFAKGSVVIGGNSGDYDLTVHGDIYAADGVWAETGSYDQFRALSSQYGFMIRNDNAATYFLLTNLNDRLGSWNSLRPFSINNATGAVQMNAGVSVNGSHTVTNGDSSYTTYGPNGTWGGSITVGAGANTISAGEAQVISTNGNLHLDGGVGQEVYLNYYNNIDQGANGAVTRVYGILELYRKVGGALETLMGELTTNDDTWLRINQNVAKNIYTPRKIWALDGLEAGSSTLTKDMKVLVRAGDSYKAGFEAYGSAQGTGYVYVGQSSAYGGGIIYQGDTTPAVISGSSADMVTLFRRSNGTDYAVMEFSQGSDDVTFFGDVTSEGMFVANDALVLADQWGLSAGAIRFRKFSTTKTDSDLYSWLLAQWGTTPSVSGDLRWFSATYQSGSTLLDCGLITWHPGTPNYFTLRRYNYSSEVDRVYEGGASTLPYTYRIFAFGAT